ncbi:MAG: choice-of-anchor Q domain-containing protein [Myxococcota bacterium]|nr:choice-of-anchor Q domain-containing protein [Myxococcota bacterium]
MPLQSDLALTLRRLCAGSMLAVALVHGPGDATAATIVVDSLADENTASPPNGTCTLREAVLAANGNVPVDGCAQGDGPPTVDTIQVPAGTIFLSIAGAGEDAGETGDLDLAGALDPHGDVEIVGAGVGATVIDANAIDRAFHVQANPPGDTDARVEIRGLGIRDGAGGPGAGVLVGAAATAVLADLEITDSEGGVSNAGSLTATRIVVSDNDGDGIVTGGIFGSLTLADSTVSGNGGHGIANSDAAFVTGTTVSGNTGDGIRTTTGLGAVTGITNSTISGNAIELYAEGAQGLITHVQLTNATVVGPGLVVANQGFADFTFANSVIDGFCFGSGPWITLGGNVESPLHTCGLVDATDQPSTSTFDLALGALGDNGGPTRTHALGGGSVAVAAGVAAECPAVDQRGVVRAPDCDAGAFELDGETAIVVDSTADENAASPDNGSCTLREAIQAANDDVPVDGCRSGTVALDRIVVPPGQYVLTLAGSGDGVGDLDVTGSVEIVGAGAPQTVIEADHGDRVFAIAQLASATIEGVTVTGGRGPSLGGGIHNAGQLTLREVSVEENSAVSPFSFIPSFGGGVYNGATGTLTIESSTLHSNGTNSAGSGGGIYNTGGTVTATNSTISMNFAGTGGAVAADGEVTLESVTVADNVATTGGWGLDSSSGSLVFLGNTLLDDGCSGLFFVSMGGNMEVAGNTCSLGQPTDRVAVPDASVNLSLLGDHGGPTPTHRIPPESIARGAAEHDDCPADDQRGRPRDAACDVGAFEYNPAGPACGLGAEGGLLLIPLARLRAHLQRRRAR